MIIYASAPTLENINVTPRLDIRFEEIQVVIYYLPTLDPEVPVHLTQAAATSNLLFACR